MERMFHILCLHRRFSCIPVILSQCLSNFFFFFLFRNLQQFKLCISDALVYPSLLALVVENVFLRVLNLPY